MKTLTVRMPDEKHERLRRLARHREISINKLFNELATAAITEFDAETRFRAGAALGSPEVGLELLAKVDRKTAVRQDPKQ